MERFVFPKSFYDSIKTFKPVQRDMLYTAIFAYVFEDKSTQFTNNELTRLWILIQPILAKSKKISETKSEQCRDNVATLSEHCQDKIETTLNTRLKEKEREKDKEKEKKDKEKSTSVSSSARFVKPTVEQVQEYITEKGYHFSAKSFHAFYESKGWRVGNTPMKSWKAACVTWENREPHPEAVEKEEEYHPLEPFTKCPVCGGKHVSNRSGNGMCESCGIHFVWSYTSGTWKEEA